MAEQKLQEKKEKPQRMGGGGHGGPGGMAGGAPPEKAKNFKKSAGRLISHLNPYKIQMIVVFICAIASTVFAIVGPKIMGGATTLIFDGTVGKLTGKSAGIDFAKVSGIIFTLLILYGLSSLFGFIQGFIMANVSQKVSYSFRESLDEKVSRMPLKYFDTKTHGEVLSRVTNDIDTISQSLSQSLSQAIISFTTVLGVLIMMISISIPMTLVAVLIIPISLFFVMLIVKMSQKYYVQQQEYFGHVNGQIEEVYGAHVIMKAFNAEERSVKTFNEYNNTLFTSAWKSQFLSGVMMPAMMFVGNLGYVAVSVMGSYFAVRKIIKVGDILSFIQYVRNFTMPMNQMAQIANIFQSTIAAAERVFEFLDEEEEVEDNANPASIDVIQGAVSFRNIQFGYEPEKTIIHNFSSDIKPGQKIAIVGPTGAGKTTIVKLLMRFYDVSSGEIMVDNINIKDFRRNDLRSFISMVLQDTWLFSGTIRENIRYGRLDATDEEVERAARQAQGDHFIETLPGGYNMELNEEASNISQGQKQLLTIARAILSDPKILILDEATSSVDTRTEVLIQKAMNNLMKGRTSFIIAHRLSTIRDADLILVMDKGDIVEQGTHKELLEQNGFYANLYNTQFDGTGEED